MTTNHLHSKDELITCIENALCVVFTYYGEEFDALTGEEERAYIELLSDFPLDVVEQAVKEAGRNLEDGQRLRPIDVYREAKRIQAVMSRS